VKQGWHDECLFCGERESSSGFFRPATSDEKSSKKYINKVHSPNDFDVNEEMASIFD
jgi:hypothetical protein